MGWTQKEKKEYNKNWTRLNPDKVKEYNARRRKKGKETGWETTKKWRQNNPDKPKAYAKAWRGRNTEKVREATKKRYHENKAYDNIVSKLHYQKVKKERQFVTEYKEKCTCKTCGEQDPSNLHFHHIEPSKKSFSLAAMAYHSVKEVRQEMAKCHVLCKECHTRVHHPVQKGLSA